MRDSPITISAILNPTAALSYDGRDWHQLISQARALKLLPYLKLQFERAGLWQQLPRGPKLHIHSAWIQSSSIYHATCWELDNLSAELKGVGWIPLKGAAYALLQLPHARYRLAGDVDVLVDKNAIDKAELLLKLQGWRSESLDAYDTRYYREWSHEVPPMVHPERGTVLDLHHNLFPLVSSAVRVNIAAFRQGAQLNDSGIRGPCPEDLFLHSALHLFMQEEFSSAVRDLIDMREIYRYGCSTSTDFPESLKRRAKLLGLQRPCWFAARYLRSLLGEDIPEMKVGAVNPVAAWCYDRLFTAVFFDVPHQKQPWYLGLARRVLEARGHSIKMSPSILIAHLWHKVKSWSRVSQKRVEA